MNDKNYAKDYYMRNREYIIEKNKEYYHRTKNADRLIKMREYNAEYYKKNKTNWNTRYNNMSLEEKQMYRKKYYQPKKEKKIKEIPYKEPNFLISFN